MRQLVTHKLPGDISSVRRALAVPVDSKPRRRERRYALKATGGFCDANSETTGVREAPPGKTQKAHDVL